MGKVILYMAVFLSIFSSPRANSSSCPFTLDPSYLKYTRGLYSSSMKSSISSQVQVAWLFSDTSSMEARSLRLSTELPSSQQMNFSRLVEEFRCWTMVFSNCWQISRILCQLNFSSISSSFSLKPVKYPVLSFLVNPARWDSYSPFPISASSIPLISPLGSSGNSSAISQPVSSLLMTSGVSIWVRSASSSLLGNCVACCQYSNVSVALSSTCQSCVSMGCVWACGRASARRSILFSRVFLMLAQTRDRQSQQSVLLNRCAINE